MKTFQGMRTNIDYITEQIRNGAVKEIFEKFKEADKRYYQTSEGGNIAAKLYK